MDEKRWNWRRALPAVVVLAIMVGAIVAGVLMPGASPHWKEVKVGMPRGKVEELIGKAHQSSDDATGTVASRTDEYFIEENQLLRILYKNDVVTRVQVMGRP